METARIKLRRMLASDYANMRVLDSDPDVMKFTPAKIPQTEEQTRERICTQMAGQNQREPFGIWLAETTDTKEFIGWFMLLPTEPGTLEIGFMLTQSSWGHGYATEIAQRLIEFAEEKGVKFITAQTNLDNFSSIRVLEKLGLKFSKNILVPEKISGMSVELKFFELKID